MSLISSKYEHSKIRYLSQFWVLSDLQSFALDSITPQIEGLYQTALDLQQQYEAIIKQQPHTQMRLRGLIDSVASFLKAFMPLLNEHKHESQTEALQFLANKSKVLESFGTHIVKEYFEQFSCELSPFLTALYSFTLSLFCSQNKNEDIPSLLSPFLNKAKIKVELMDANFRTALIRYGDYISEEFRSQILREVVSYHCMKYGEEEEQRKAEIKRKQGFVEKVMEEFKTIGEKNKEEVKEKEQEAIALLFPHQLSHFYQDSDSSDSETEQQRFSKLLRVLIMRSRGINCPQVAEAQLFQNLMGLTPLFDNKPLQIRNADMLLKSIRELSEERHEDQFEEVEENLINLGDSRYDFYRDPNPREVLRLYKPLVKTAQRLVECEKVAPGQPLLAELLVIIGRFMNMRLFSIPLNRALAGLEILLGKLEDWESLASRRINTVATEMELVKGLIVRYRKIEMKSWRGILRSRRIELEEREAVNFLKFAVIIEHTTEPDALFKLVDLFMREANLGSFNFKIQCLKMIAPLSALAPIIRFVAEYYELNFSQALNDTLKQDEHPLQKKVNDIVNIHKWKVHDFFQIKDTITRTHRQLYQLVKKHEDVLLHQSVASCLLNKSRQRLSDLQRFYLKLQDLKKQNSALSVSPQRGLQQWTQQSLKKAVKIAHRFTKFQEKEGTIAKCEQIAEEIFSRVKLLREEEASKNMKRKALADLFRALQEVGLSSAVDKQHKIYNINANKLEEKQRRYIYKSIEMQQMLQSMSSLHPDIQGSELTRMTRASGNMLQQIFTLLKLRHTSQSSFQLTTYEEITQVHQTLIEAYISSRREMADLLSQLRTLLQSSYADFPSVSELLNSIQKLLHQPIDLKSFYDSSALNSVLEFLNDEAQIVESIRAVYEVSSVPFFDSFIKDTLIAHSQVISTFITEVSQKKYYSQDQNETHLQEVNRFEKMVKYAAQILYKYQKGEQQRLGELIKVYRSLTSLYLPKKAERLLSAISGVRLSSDTLMRVKDCILGYEQLSSEIETCMINTANAMAKLVYVVESVFVTLSFHGYCESKDEENEEQEGEEEWKDGTGVGEGKGEQDVSKEIEHEEQVEGLRGDEGDNKGEEEGEKKEQGEEKEEGGFEMEQDFEPEEEKKEDQERNESELDQEKGSVSELLDNQLWDDNYSLGSDEDQEDQGKEEEPVDLEDRREADGPKEEKAKQEEERKKQDREKEGEEERDDERDNKEEGEALQEEKKQENVPLERDEHVSIENSESDEGMDVEEEFNQKREEEDKGGLEEEGKEEEGEENDFDIEDLKYDEKLEEEQGEEEKQFSFGNPEAGGEEQDEPQQREEEIEEDQVQIEQKQEDAYGQADEEQGQDNRAAGGGGEEGQQKEQESMDVMEDIKAENEAKKGKAKGEKKEQKKQQKDEENKEKKGAQNKREEVKEVQMEKREKNVEDKQGEEYEAVSENEEAEEDRAGRAPAQDIQEQPVEVQDRRQEEQEEDEDQGNEGLLPGELKMEVERGYEQNKGQLEQEKREREIEQEREEQRSPQFKIYEVELDQLDMEQERASLNESYEKWLKSGEKVSESRDLLLHFKNTTGILAGQLCEKLRAVLQPTERSSFVGDFRSGKRLNMRKIIPFVASNYRNDKIWLRRSLPQKRDYRVLLAIDDSASMKQHGLGLFSLETLITISTALLRLEVGRIAVASIQDRLNLLHDFNEPLTQEKQSFLLSQFSFSYHSPTSANTAMPNFLFDCNQFLLSQQKPSHFEIVIVLSDGVLNKENVRPMLRAASDKGLLYLFVILDSQRKKTILIVALSSSKSIFNKRSVRQEKGKVSFSPFLEDFPFPHYCILSVKFAQQQHIEHLPQKIAACMLQWVEETQQST